MPFDIREYLDHLEPTGEKEKYYCPSCSGHNLSINRKSGKYNCWDCGDTKAVARELRNLAGGDEAWKEEKRQEWLERKRLEEERKQKEWEEQSKRQLPPRERDRVIREIIEQLVLSPEHKALLKSRRLTDRQISESEYCSVRQWQKLRKPADFRLPGVNQMGNLNNPYDGILIPIPDRSGNYIALRLHDPNYKENGNPKYAWLTSSGRGLNPVLPNGEHPIAVYYPSEISQPNKVGLCEGLEWKPKLAAERLGYPVIGFAGVSFFPKSPETLKATLEKLALEEAVFIPDAGAIINSNVHEPATELMNMAGEWGYSINIAWWNQIEKDNNDIDEISDETLAQIRLISYRDYCFIHRREMADRQSEEQARWQWENYKKQAHKLWQKRRQFTPDHIVNRNGEGKYIDRTHLPSELPEGKIYAIKSGLGTGKTELLKTLNDELDDEGLLVLGHRNSLLHQTAERIGGWHLVTCEQGGYHNGSRNEGMFKAEALRDDPGKTVLLCFDSLHKFEPWQFEGRNLALDETTTGLAHLLTSSTEVKKRLTLTLELFQEALKRCKRVFCLDGMLSDRAIDYLQKLSGKDSHKVLNDHQQSVSFNLLTGVTSVNQDEDGNIIEDHKPNKNAPLIDCILKSECPVVVSDNKFFLLGLEELMRANGRKKGLVITGSTSGEDWAKEFLASPNEYISIHKPSYLFLSPSVQDGVDISIRDYFTDLFCLFHGIISVTAAHQMAFRIRDENIDRWLWAKTFSESDLDTAKSPFPNATKRYHQEAVLADLRLNLDECSEKTLESLYNLLRQETEHDLHYDYQSDLRANESYEKGNFRECLIESLQSHGHGIEEFTPDDIFNHAYQAIKDAKTSVKERHAKAIYNAEDINPDAIDEHHTGKQEDQWKVQKALLKQRVKGIEESECWSPETIKEVLLDDPLAIPKIRRRIMFFDLELTKKLQRKRWRRLLLGYEHKFHFRSDYLRVKALKDAGLKQIIWRLQAGNPITQDDEQLQTFIENCRTYEFKLAVGKSPTKKTQPIKWLNQALEQIGYSLESQRTHSDTRQYVLEGLPSWSTEIEVLMRGNLEDNLEDSSFQDIIKENINGSSEQNQSEKAAADKNAKNGQTPHHWGENSGSSNPYFPIDNSLRWSQSDHNTDSVDNNSNTEGSNYQSNIDGNHGDTEIIKSKGSPWNDPDVIKFHWTDDEPQQETKRLEDYERGDLIWFINDKGRWVKGFVAQKRYKHDENFRHKEFYGLLCKEGVWQMSGGVLIPHGYEACILPRQADADEAECSFPEAGIA